MVMGISWFIVEVCLLQDLTEIRGDFSDSADCERGGCFGVKWNVWVEDVLSSERQKSRVCRGFGGVRCGLGASSFISINF